MFIEDGKGGRVSGCRSRSRFESTSRFVNGVLFLVGGSKMCRVRSTGSLGGDKICSTTWRHDLSTSWSLRGGIPLICA